MRSRKRGQRYLAATTKSCKSVNSELADRLVCPVCRSNLKTGSDVSGKHSMECSSCSRHFQSESGIPLLYWPSGDTDIDDVSDQVKKFYEENPFPGYEDTDTAQKLVEKAGKGIAQLLDEQIPRDSDVLEVGCGTGQLSNFLAIGGRRVIGVDVCLNSLRMGRQFSVRNRITTANFVQMNLFKPVFPHESFDFVICNGVLHHTDNPDEGFKSLSKLVRPGGHILIGLYNKYGRIWTDIRRKAFRLFSNRLRFLDPYMRRSDVADSKKHIWFADQYLHPHESEHTMDEVLGWFDNNGFEYVNGIPKLSLLAHVARHEALFKATDRGSRSGRMLSQIKLALSGGREGGFFSMIGRKMELKVFTDPEAGMPLVFQQS